MSRIKVLHITQSVGGVETYLKQVISTINHEKFEIKIIGTVSEHLEKYCHKYGVHFLRLKMSRGLNPATDLQSVIRLKKIIKKENPALVHLHSSKAGFLGRIACRQAGYISIFTPHALSYLSFNGVKRKAFFQLEKIAKKFTDKILAVSHSESKILQEELGYHVNDIFVIPNSLIIQEDKSYIEKGLYKLNTKLKVGTIGRLTPQKNPLLFTDIAADVISALGSEVHFYFLGAGEHDHLKNEVLKKVAGYKIENNFHLLQRGDLNTSISFLQQIDIFLFPSVFEGLSYALLEAMHEKLPCVVSNVPGNNDVVINNSTGFTCAERSEYKNAICTLLTDKILAKKMGMAAREFLEQHHDLRKNIQQLENMYYLLSKK